MAMESQGVHLLKSAATVSTLTTTLNTETSRVLWPDAGADFAVAGFTTAMYVALSDSTDLHPVKAVASTVLTIFGTWETTGSAAKELTGYTMNRIGEVTDFTGPGGAAAVIDVTSLDSTAKGKLVGLRDEGQLSFSVNFVATDAQQEALIADRAARTRGKYVVRFTDVTTSATGFPSFCALNAYALQFSISGAVDNKLSGNVVLEVDGAVDWSTKDG